MPSTIPSSFRNAWGEELARDVTHFIEETVREQGVPRDEYREVLSRLDTLEREVQVRFEAVDGRLVRIEARLDEMSAQTNTRFDTMNDRFDRMNDRFDRMHEAMRVQTRWTVGAIVIIGAILAALLSIAEFAA